MRRGEEVHGELITDGDASTPTVLVLYKSGTTTVRALAATEYLNITDLTIISETGGDFALIAGAVAAAGLYIAYGALAANGGLDKAYVTPYTCPIGVTPYFTGAGTNRSTCIIEGFLTSV